MKRAMVCSAEHEYRSSCGIACEACRFLIGDRRSRREGRIQWTRSERRSLSSLLPVRQFEFAGAPAAAIEGTREIAAPWHLLGWLLVFNLLDCIFTYRALSMGYSEGNPVMASLIEFNLPMAMLAKTLVVGAGAFFLWRNRHVKLASSGLLALTIVYGMLVLYHVSFQAIA